MSESSEDESIETMSDEEDDDVYEFVRKHEIPLKKYRKKLGKAKNISPPRKNKWYEILSQCYICNFRKLQTEFFLYNNSVYLTMVLSMCLFLSFCYFHISICIGIFEPHIISITNTNSIIIVLVVCWLASILQFFFMFLYFAVRKKICLVYIVYLIHLLTIFGFYCFLMSSGFRIFNTFEHTLIVHIGLPVFLFPIFPSYIKSSIMLFFLAVRYYVFDGYIYKEDFENRNVSVSTFTTLALVSIILSLISCYQRVMTMRIFSRKKALQKKFDIVQEREFTNQDLIDSVLPKGVSEKLRQNPYSNFGYECDCCVGFFKIGGLENVFSVCTNVEQVISEANSIFTFVDSLIDTFSVEKVKIVNGDTLFFYSNSKTCGNDYFATNSFFFSVFVAQELYSSSSSFQLFQDNQKFGDVYIRIGISTGRCVFALIGSSKFLWDVFGDTVNLASRLSTTADKGMIHMSEEMMIQLLHEDNDYFKELLGCGFMLGEEDERENDHEEICFRKKKNVYMKGKGDVDTWNVLWKKIKNDLILKFIEKS